MKEEEKRISLQRDGVNYRQYVQEKTEIIRASSNYITKEIFVT